MYNHPWIKKLHPTSTFRTTKLTIQALGYTTESSRFWKKVRRRLHTEGILRFYVESTTTSQGWDLLVMLDAGGRLAFEASKRLRSSEYSHLHIFALHRLANHLEDPPRTRVVSLIKKVIEFRGLATPKQQRPLVIPMLAHSSYKQAVEAFIRNQIHAHKELLVPFHLPSVQVVAGKLPSMKDLLYKPLQVQTTWSWTTPPRCLCGALHLRRHPDVLLAQDHVASPLKKLNVSRRLRHILSFSANSQVSPSFEDYKVNTSVKVQQWMHQNGINCYNPTDWSNFITEQWPLHSQSAWVLVKKKDIMFLKQLLRGFVVHGRDHAINEMFIFCPFMYWKVVRATLGINKCIAQFQ